MIQQPALAPAWPVVRLSSSPPRPRSSVPAEVRGQDKWRHYLVTFMNDDGSADDACVSTELDQMVLNPHNGNLIITDGDIAKVANMSIL